MNRQEFLEILRSQLAGHMQEGKAAAHVRYYEDYIQSQVRGGRTEQEVLDQLGDPRLIAKTLIDTEGDTVDEEYGAYSSCGSGLEPPPQPEKRWKKVLDLSTWSGKLVVIVAACCSDYFITYNNWCRSSVFYYSDYHFICYFLVYQEKSLIKRELPLGASF